MADIDAEVAAVADALKLAAVRAERLQRILDGYEVYGDDAPDPSAPFASKIKTGPTGTPVLEHPRYALVWQYGDKGNYRVNVADDLARLRDLAANEIHEGALISCYFDLDELAGEEPLPLEVEYQGEVWMVHGRETDPDSHAKGMDALVYTGRWTLKKSPKDRRRSTYDFTTVDPAECDLLGWEDERMPVRYGVAGVNTVIAFNTIPSP